MGGPPERSSFAALHHEHLDLVWRNLRRLGVREDDLPDET
jgi:hypothetical protein